MNNNFFEQYGLRNIINVSGTMTSLGASRVSENVASEVKKSLNHWVEMDRIQDQADKVISKITGAEAGFVTACAAAGISLSVAAAMTGKNLGNVVKLPDTESLKNQVIIQKGHVVNFGANIRQMINLTGAKTVEFGSVSGCSLEEMEGAISEQTAAAVFVVSHHTVQYGMIKFEEFVSLAHQYDLPVIVDAAAEYLFADYIKRGGDIVCCSGHKFLYGPTSGLVAGKKELVEACRLQEKGIGRTMKIGKEGIIGLIAALKQWENRDFFKEHEEVKDKAVLFVNKLMQIKGLKIFPVKDPTGNPITRVQLNVDEKITGISASELSASLKMSKDPIITRDHHVDEGYFQLELRFINQAELEYIVSRIKEIIST